MSACIAAYFNSFITCLAKELHQTVRDTGLQSAYQLEYLCYHSSVQVGSCVQEAIPIALPGSLVLFGCIKRIFFINQPRTKAVTLPPSDHPSATTLNTQRSWTIAACSSETSSQPDARNEFQSREKRDPHISEKCHTGRGKYLSLWLLSTLSVERLLAEGEDFSEFTSYRDY